MADQEEEDTNKPSFRRSAEGVALERHLSVRSEGDIVTFEEIAKIIHTNPRTRGYGIVSGARKRLLKQGAVWLIAHDEEGQSIGLKCATASEVLEATKKNNVSLRRKNDKNVAYLGTVELESLSTEEKRECLWLQSVAGALALFCNQIRTPQLENKVKSTIETEGEAVSSRKMLELFAS